MESQNGSSQRRNRDQNQSQSANSGGPVRSEVPRMDAQPPHQQFGLNTNAYNEQMYANQHQYGYSQQQPMYEQQMYGGQQQYSNQYASHTANQYGNYPTGPLPTHQTDQFGNSVDTHYPGFFHKQQQKYGAMDGPPQTYEMSRLPTVNRITSVYQDSKSRWTGGDVETGDANKPEWQVLLGKYLCCCCPKSKKGKLICGVSVLVVTIVLGVLLYVYLPRYPQIKVYGIDFTNILGTGSAYSFTYANPDVHDLNTLNFKMNLSMSLGTFNPNPYDLNVESINLVARITVNQTYVGQPLQTTPLTSFGSLVSLIPLPKNVDPSYTGDMNAVVGTSSHGQIVFPAKSSVNYTMIFLLNFTPDPKLGLLQDPTILEIASACGITDRKNRTRPMAIHYDAASTIGALKPLGFVPQLSSDLHINCPFSKAQIDSVIAKVQDQNETIMQALQETFSGAQPPPKPEVVNPDGSSANSGNGNVGGNTGNGNNANGGVVTSAVTTSTSAPTIAATGGNGASATTTGAGPIDTAVAISTGSPGLDGPPTDSVMVPTGGAPTEGVPTSTTQLGGLTTTGAVVGPASTTDDGQAHESTAKGAPHTTRSAGSAPEPTP
ncbi:hypothetical protein BC830DRAFT_1218469 [Chytriomyces sp. MP71]|nr:hypothetical protein BC830DRAFT_1218469 [Chytriomyces sp. MP71]